MFVPDFFPLACWFVISAITDKRGAKNLKGLVRVCQAEDRGSPIDN